MPSDQPNTPGWWKAEKLILEMARRYYPSRAERDAVRSGFEDAAVLCEAIAKTLPEKEAATAKLCGDAIWKMRNKLQVPHD